MNPRDLKKKYDEEKCWGMLASINLYDCNPAFIRDPQKIKGYIDTLCVEIHMQKHGPTYVERFAVGELEGYSAMQFIETSTITIHCDEVKNRAFIDIFSCKFFDHEVTDTFSKTFFQSSRSEVVTLLRR